MVSDRLTQAPGIKRGSCLIGPGRLFVEWSPWYRCGLSPWRSADTKMSLGISLHLLDRIMRERLHNQSQRLSSQEKVPSLKTVCQMEVSVQVSYQQQQNKLFLNRQQVQTLQAEALLVCAGFCLYFG